MGFFGRLRRVNEIVIMIYGEALTSVDWHKRFYQISRNVYDRLSHKSSYEISNMHVNDCNIVSKMIYIMNFPSSTGNSIMG